jgi:general stress protein 26
MTPADEKRDQLFKIVKDFNNAFLVTHRADGGFHGRPLAVAGILDDGRAFFATSMRSPKVAEIAADEDVLITFQSGAQFATLTGKAALVRDRGRIEELWRDAWTVWFPEGKSDPNLILIEVIPDEGEYWNAAGFEGVHYAFEAVKALLTGTTPKVDEGRNAKVAL